MLNLSGDRYRFAVGLGAALLRGHTSLLPPNHDADTVARLRALFADVYALVEGDADAPRPADALRHADGAGTRATQPTSMPRIAADLVAAQVLTSGSTGAPVPHAKPWGLLVRNAAGRGRSASPRRSGVPSSHGVTLVATVPPQHMYGFESTVLVALLGGAAFDAGRPFYRPTSPPRWRARRARACW